MRGDLDRTREEDVERHQEFIRQGRVKARQITKQLEETKQHLFENKETNDGRVTRNFIKSKADVCYLHIFYKLGNF